MKFTSGLISLIVAGGIATVDANMSIRGNTKTANKLMTFSRRLEDGQNYGNNNDYQGGYGNNNQNNQNGEQANNYQGGYGNNNQNNQNGEQANNYQGAYGNNYQNNGGNNNNQNQNGQYQNGNGNYGGGYGDGDEDEESMYFLNNFSLKLLSCIQGEQIIDYESGEMEPSTVVFRLCPASTCDVNSEMGCDSGYGDYAVGINTFLEAYMEQQQENENQYGQNSMVSYNSYGQAFDASEYMECAAYDAEDAADQDYNYNQYNNNNGQQQQQNNNYNGGYNNNDQQQQQQQNNNYNGGYNNNNGGQRRRRQQNNNYNYYSDVEIYIGPGCSADGTTIGLQMFMDEDCSYAANINFSDLAYGWDNGLPFADGGLISMNCMACYGPDEDYNYELSEMCTETYSASTSRCETNMASYSYYGQRNNGCNYIDTLVQSVYGSGSNDDNVNDVDDATSLSTSFMDTMNTREARAFIAGMIIFCLSAVCGSAIFGYFCVQKKKRQRAAAQGKLLDDDGDYEPPVDAMGGEYGNDQQSVQTRNTRRSSVVALVRDGATSIKEGVITATAGAKVVLANATTKTEKALAPLSYD